MISKIIAILYILGFLFAVNSIIDPIDLDDPGLPENNGPTDPFWC